MQVTDLRVRFEDVIYSPRVQRDLGEWNFWEMSYWQIGLKRAFGTQSQLETLSMR